VGGINFGCLAVWVLSQHWLLSKLEVSEIFRRLGEAAAPRGEEGGRAVPRLCIVYLAFDLQLRKIMENLGEDN